MMCGRPSSAMREEPHHHDRPEHLADGGGALALDREQTR